MFWDRVAGVYDLFVNIYNKKTHDQLRIKVAEIISPDDDVLDCAAGTGMLSVVIAPKCNTLTATDFSKNMTKKLKKKCKGFDNVSCMQADILSLPFEDNSFDKVVAANVIHLLDEPGKAIFELERVCRHGGKLIIPTYISRDSTGKENSFSSKVGKAGAGFKRHFTYDAYKQFFTDSGFADAKYFLCEGKVPCAVAVISKR